MAGSNPLRKIEHIVVLMLENRSFDNVLGWLYDPANDAPFNLVPPDFDGLYGKGLSNPAPDGRIIPAGKTDDPRSPQPNPGEPFEDVYSQVYDQPKVALRDVPPDPPCVPNMRGFIRNYAAQDDKPADPADIMLALTPKALPVLSALAHHYAVCDRWFSSVPTQTFSNRSFLHAGTASGYVNNDGAGWGLINETPTIFDLLEQAQKSWTVFCGAWLLQSFTLLSQRSTWKYALTHHFAHLQHFFSAAAKKGGLPNYSFLEPVYFDSIVWGPENDMHSECTFYEFFGPSSSHRGEALVWKIYNAVRDSPDWERTLLIILFDEHGGCYDHVPPPTVKDCNVAISPDDKVIAPDQPGGSGFRFDRLGPRVPAIIVSAYTPPQTRLHDVFEHTSILSSVVNCFGLPPGQFGRRQANALDVGAALQRSGPRQDRPPIPEPHPSLLEDLGAEWQAIVHSKFLGARLHPITDMQRIALHCAALFTDQQHLHERIHNLETQLEADLLRAEQEARLAARNGRW
jgi:phospholipase C